MSSTDAPNRRLSRLAVHLWLTLGVSLLLGASFALYVRAEKNIDTANAVRQQSYFLADELRQSSDDLTRMVRSYVATGDVAYKQQFDALLALREGRLPRPVNYQGADWELAAKHAAATAAGPAPSGPSALSTPSASSASSVASTGATVFSSAAAAMPDAALSFTAGQAVPLLELVRRAGFTRDEIALLEGAKDRSDALTAIERKAMRLIETAQPDREAARAQATAMLYDAVYHREKGAIMQSILEFGIVTDQRTLNAVRQSEQRALRLRVLFLGLVGLLLVLVWKARGEVLAVLGGPVHELYRHIARLGSGDLSAPPAHVPAPRDSVLGWIGETRQRLAQVDAERTRAEQELARYRSRLEQLVEERTQALAMALDRAEAASRAKSVFLSNMSHELRTPLNAVIGFSELMARSSSLSGDEKENLHFIHYSGKHLLMLIDQVLALSRTDAAPASGALSDVGQLGTLPAAVPDGQPGRRRGDGAHGQAAGTPHSGVDGATACARQDGPHGWQGAGQPQGPGDGQRIGQSAGADPGRHGGGGALPDGAVLPADVQALDNATYNALCDAVQHLNSARLDALVEQLAQRQPLLARGIACMAQRLAYPELLEALQRARAPA